MFLATRKARCIRFQITDETLRVFAGRGSSGVRGIRLAEGDEVISLAILNHVEATVEERSTYLRMANAKRRAENAAEGEEDTETTVVETDEEDDAASGTALLTPERFTQLEEAEEILLVVSDGGFGRRSSAYDYRVSGRGGQGITNMTFSANKRGTEVAATLQVLDGTDVMLVTDAGRLIRVPVDQVRVMSRQASGVTLFRLNDEERVTSVFPVMDDEDAGNAEEAAPVALTGPSAASSTPSQEGDASPDDEA